MNNDIIKLSGKMKEIAINSQDRIKRDCNFPNSPVGIETLDLLAFPIPHLIYLHCIVFLQYNKEELTMLELFYAIRRIPMKGEF